VTRFDRPDLAVVKVGSSSLRGADGQLDRAQVHTLAEQIVRVRASGTRVVLVSSGAVAAGMGLLGLRERPADLQTLQACAAVGQGELIHAYQRTLRTHGLSAAQILLTPDDFGRRRHYLNARHTLQRLLALGAVPVINENDAVATDELAYGDNDHLAALVASMLDAQLLLLLSDVAGLYDDHPGADGARLVDRVDHAGELDLARVGGVGSHVGSGGMRTKVEAALIATASTAHAVVADARRADVIADVVAGEAVGTWFVAGTRRLEARRLWIGYALRPTGRLHVDAGAVRALVDHGRSLLAVGITAADGDFQPGDAVEVVGPDGAVVARGLVAYGAEDVRRIAGRTTLEAVEALGPGYAREVLHRDDLAVRVPSRSGDWR
jgi:glutamate 5-kinase